MYVKPYNLKHNQVLPWIMYCDFESILVPIKDAKHSDKYEQKLSSYCYNLVCRERPSFTKLKLYRGKSENDPVIDTFFNDIKNILIHILQCRKKYYALPVLTKLQQEKHDKATKSDYYDIEFDENNERCAHHNHITGDFIAKICVSCISKMKTNNCLYIVIHYLKGYDIQFILSKIMTTFQIKILILSVVIHQIFFIWEQIIL